MHELPWNTSAFASVALNMSLIHVVQKHKIIDATTLLKRQAIPQSHTPKKIFVLSMGGKCNNILLGLRSLCYNSYAWHFSTIISNDNANFAGFLQYSITLSK